MKKNRSRWLGYVERRNNDEMVKKIGAGINCGKKPDKGNAKEEMDIGY